MIRSSIPALLAVGPLLAATTALAAQSANPFPVEIARDPPTAQPVGTTFTWTVRSSSDAPMLYRLSIESEDGVTEVLVDFRRSNVVEWTPSREGRYVVKAAARDDSTGEVAQAAAESFEVLSRVRDSPVVTLTDHPLVALYSSPPCQPGLRMRILFKARDARTPDVTPSQLCDGAKSMNFYVAGLVERMEYAFRAELLRDETVPYDYGPELTLRTGPADVALPPRRTTLLPTARTSPPEDVLLQAPAGNTVLAGATEAAVPVVPWASDLRGRILWYYDGDPHDWPSLVHPVPGGTFLITLAEDDLEGQFLREIDVAGNVVRETNRKRVSEQLVARGQDEIGAFHHDAIRLPDGKTAVIASVERILEGVQGPFPVDILGDMIIVLNEDWQVVWVWNSFDHLDVTRRATLNETCSRADPGCPPFFLADVVNDWTHTNAVTYSPIDGHLLFSVRNQDWVVKASYDEGMGNGEVLWRLGPEGDFTIESDDPYPWLSHQHDPRFVDNNHLIVYDNGNTRCAAFPDLCYSRGQVYRIDQRGRVATLTLNFNLQTYAFALGSSQPLANGNFHFNTGVERRRNGPGWVATSDEVSADGRQFVFAHLTESEVYRSWRLTDLYMTGNGPESLAYAERLFGHGASN